MFMKSILFYVFLIAMPLLSQAQTKKVDTLTRKYIVLEPRKNKGRTIVIPERKVIKVKTVFDRTYRGKFTIINDSQIAIFDKFNGEMDTISLIYISKLRRPTLEYQIISYYLLINGIGGIIIGAAILVEFSQTLLGPLFGTMFIASGVPYTLLGASLYDGPKYYAQKYHFKTVKTKGYKLKPVRLPIKTKPAKEI